MKFIPGNNFHSEVNANAFAENISESAPLPDTLRAQTGPQSINSQVNNRHPLELRIRNWDSQQQELKMTQYKQIFGLAEPLRRTMELEVVNATDFKPSCVDGGFKNDMHSKIMLGKDMSIDWEDVYGSSYSDGMGNIGGQDIHTEFERNVGI